LRDGAEGCGEGTCRGQRVAPCVVGVFHNDGFAAVCDADDVALGILQVEVVRAVVSEAHDPACIVVEVQGVGAVGHLHQVGAVVDIQIYCQVVVPTVLEVLSLSPS